MRKLWVVVVVGLSLMAVRIARELRVTNPQGELVLSLAPVLVDGGATGTVLVSNISRLTVDVSAVTLFGDDAGVFTLTGPVPASLGVGVSREYRVDFAPRETGDFSARVVVDSNDDLSPRNADLVICARAVPSLDGGVTPPCTALEAPPLPVPPAAAPQGCSSAGGGALVALALALRRRHRP